MGKMGAVDAGSEIRVSKADVLVLAKKHIEGLERTNTSLQDDKRSLLKSMERLKGALVHMGYDAKS